MTDRAPFLSLISHIQQSNQCLARKAAQTERHDLQLDLFYEEPAIVADRIVKDGVDSIHAAGVNLSDLKVQLAVGAWRERTTAFLRQLFQRNSR
jgi:hypothetical protein